MTVKQAIAAFICVLAAACGAETPISVTKNEPHQTDTPPDPFISVDGMQFIQHGEPYQYVGVNFWFGAYLAAPGQIGDIERLRAELDLLKSLGVDNLRVLGGSESGPMRDSIKPTFRGPGDEYNEELLTGLDILLAEMSKRDMKAVIYLTNFWEWSGGVGTYLYWVNGGEYVDLSDPTKPWPAFVLHNMAFYANADANALLKDYIQAVVTRTNSVTGVAYKDDPTIMAWQLMNEPRAGYKANPGEAELEAFHKWIDETAGYIKSLDENHLVSTGNEGFMGCADHLPCFKNAHKTENIDYLTFHMWPKNWGWLDDNDMEGSFDRVLSNADDYIALHISDAKELNKPIVLEEFGLPRDLGSLSPETTTVLRDQFYEHVFESIEDSAKNDGPLVGSNIWSWGGYGRAEHADGIWKDGDTSYTGDPPQEPQGLNSVFDSDQSTLDILKAHAEALQ